MFLSDKAIKHCIESGKIIIEPTIDLADVRAAGIRVHLNDKILIPKQNQTIDLKNPTELDYDEHFLQSSPYTMKPGEFILASTIEKIGMDRTLLAFIDGRSTIARLGLTVHLSSTTMDGNYDEARATTLEMKNAGAFSITLNFRDPVGMVLFAEMNTPVEQTSQTQYKGQDGVVAPNLSYKTGVDH